MVTLSKGAASPKEKRAPEAFWPVPATTPFWPAVVYTGIDGEATTTSATVPFPTPPASIGPDAPAPPAGSWPQRAVQPVYDPGPGTETPLVGECSFLSFEDPNCVTQPWYWGTIGGSPDDGDDIENAADLRTKCPAQTSSSSSSSSSTRATATTSAEPSPTPSPYVQGNPLKNNITCYNSGETTEDVRLQYAARSFCGDIENDSLIAGYVLPAAGLRTNRQRRIGHSEHYDLNGNQDWLQLRLGS